MSEVALTSAQRQILGALPDRVPPERIDRLWIFPARVANSRETGLFAISLLPLPERPATTRTLLTLRYVVDGSGRRARRTEQLEEEGHAPPERIERVIAGVLARSGEDAGEPLLFEIGGEAGRWQELHTDSVPAA